MADDGKGNQKRRGGLPGFDMGGSSGNPQQDRARRTRLIIWVVVLGVLAWVLYSSVGTGGQQVDYSQFLNYVKKGPNAITEVRVGTTSVSGVLRQPDGSSVRVTAERPPGDDNGALVRLLDQNRIKYTGANPSGLASFITQLIFMLILFGALYFFLFRRMGAGGANALNLGRNRVRIYDRKEM
jgi:ATP-dependent Zn protease